MTNQGCVCVCVCVCVSCSVMYDYLQLHELQPVRLLCPWNSPGTNTATLLQGTNPFSRGSSWPRDGTWVSCIAGRHFTVWASREAQSRVKVCFFHIVHSHGYLRYADDTTLMAESKEELKSLLVKMKEESEKVGLKLNIQKMNIMASGPIISWQIDGETGK